MGKVLFSFYNDQLFRIVVTYDRERTLGLTALDMIEAISTRYGLALLPATDTVPSPAPVSTGMNKILAQWDDSQHSLNLFSSSYLSTFGLVVLSKRLDVLAQLASAEAMLLDKQEAPRREIERQRTQTEGNRVKQEEGRRVNKPTFRP